MPPRRKAFTVRLTDSVEENSPKRRKVFDACLEQAKDVKSEAIVVAAASFAVPASPLSTLSTEIHGKAFEPEAAVLTKPRSEQSRIESAWERARVNSMMVLESELREFADDAQSKSEVAENLRRLMGDAHKQKAVLNAYMHVASVRSYRLSNLLATHCFYVALLPLADSSSKESHEPRPENIGRERKSNLPKR